MFPFQQLQGMQGSVWHKPHCGVQVQPRLLAASHVSQVSWARLSQRPGRKEFLHLASLRKIEALEHREHRYLLYKFVLLFLFLLIFISPNIIWWPYLDHLLALVHWVGPVLPEDDLPVGLRGLVDAVGGRHQVTRADQAARTVVLMAPTSPASLPKTRDFSNMLQTITVTWF